MVGCRPVGPGGLAIAGTAATVGTVATLLLPPVLRRVKAFAVDPAPVEPSGLPVVAVAPPPTLTAHEPVREKEVAPVG